MHRLAGILLATALSLAWAADAAAQATGPYVYGKVIVLCIGIEQYQHASLRPAPGAQNDANAVGQLLSAKYGYTPEYLIGADATKETILARLKALGNALKPEDVLIVFFAGHGKVIQRSAGMSEGYLIPYEADLDLNVVGNPDKWKEQALEMGALTRITEGFRAKHVLLMVDACCSGYMTRRGSLAFRYDLRKLIHLRSRMVVAATTESESATSRKRNGREQGIFTSALLDTLETNQPNSVSDVFVKVRNQVLLDSHDTMTPQVDHFGNSNRDRKDDLGRDDGEFVFLPLAIPAAEVAATIRRSNANIDIDISKLPRGGGGQRHVLSDVIDRANERLNLRTKTGDVIEAFEARDYRFTAGMAKLQSQWVERRRQFEENAAQGDVLAMAGMHYCLSKGLGGEKDDVRAYRWAKNAYDSGQPAGKHVYGRCLINSIGIPRNPIAAVELFKEAVKDQDAFPISYLQLGQDLFQEGDVAGARANWERAEAGGVDSARVFLAELDLGSLPGLAAKGVKPDVPAALRHLAPAVKNGHADALYLKAQIDNFYLDPPNKAEAAQVLTEAARNGHPKAQGVLARELGGSWMLSKDLPFKLGLTKNASQARRWAELAAAQDDGYGLLVLACSSEDAGNYKQAIEYCQRAKTLKFLHADILESQWYRNNKVYPKDVKKSFESAQLAAESGDDRAELWIALLYSEEDVPDGEKAKLEDGKMSGLPHTIHFLTLSAQDGNEIAHEGLRSYAKEVKANPNLPYWKFFKAKYPKDVAPFFEHANHEP